MKKDNEKFSILKYPFVKIGMLLVVFGFLGIQTAFAAISITPVTWNVIGLDSNNTTVGPNAFPVGARVCNTGSTTIANVTATFVWDSANAYINLDAGAANPLTYQSLTAGACTDFYFEAIVTRTSSAYNTTRRFHITASDGVSSINTPMPRELYVEKLISQGRNSIDSITGPTTVYVGQTYQYTVNASTATNGYEQLSAFLNLSNVVFRVLAISTTYSAPTGGANDKIYADACGWNNDLQSANYRSCSGTGKVGGTVKTIYTVKVQSTGTTTATTLIQDFSGSSYHYNADYGLTVISITALPPPVPNINLSKSVTPTGSSLPGTDLTYTINFTNSGTAAAQNFQIVDPNAGGTLRINTNTDFKVGSASVALGTTGLTAVIRYSNDNGSTFAYTPVSGAGGASAGYDHNVTHIRWTFTGNLSFTAPNNTGSISFVVKIR
jgi:uncharacterized repeat protein (TIGR01451 family)